MKERFIPLNNYILFEDVEQKKSKYEQTSTNYADKIPRGKVITKDNALTEIDVEDEFLYRIFQDIPKVSIGAGEYSLVKFEQIYDKFKK